MFGVKPNFVHPEQFYFTVHNSFKITMWLDPVHRLLSTSQPIEEWVWPLSMLSPAPGHLTEPVPRPRGTSADMPKNSILLWAGQQPQQLGYPLVWVCRRHHIFYLSSAQLVSIFRSPGFHRHLQIIEVGKIHGTLSKAMRYKVSNCWLFCEIKSKAKSTCHVRILHLLPKYTSRLCRLWRWTSGKKCDLFIENTSDRKLHPDNC